MLNPAQAELFLSKLPIRHRDTGVSVPFRFNPNQRILQQHAQNLYDAGKPLWIILLKSRRVGGSAWTEGMLTCHCLAKAQAEALIVAHQFNSSKALFSIPKGLVGGLPFKIPLNKQHEIEFPHPEGISTLKIATAGSITSGRGLTLSALHLSEAAHYPGEGSFLSLIPAVSYDPSTILIIESTANGKIGPGESFYNYWTAAEEGRSEFLPVFLCWLDDPACFRHPDEAKDAPKDSDEKDLIKVMKRRGDHTDIQMKGRLAWRRWAIETQAQGSMQYFNQEYPCLVGDTRVSTERGMILLKEAKSGEVSESGKIEKAWLAGNKRCVRVTFASGRILEGSYDHPIQAAIGEFVEMEASLGWTIRLRQPRFSELIPKGMSKEMARFLGYFMGDGCYHGRVISIACDGRDTDVVADVSKLMQDIVGRAHPRKSGVKGGCVEVRAGSVAWAEELIRLGCWNHGTGPKRKVCVPEVIFQSPEEIVKEFLMGLFEADGHNGATTNRVSLYSKHLQFLRDVQLLLLGFGITSHVKSRPAHTGEYHYTAHTLELRSKESILFNQKIGFISQRKRGRCGKAREGMGTPSMPIELLDEVVKVEQIGVLPVYDLTLEGDHTFSANGLVVHNTTPEEAFISTGEPAFEKSELAYARSSIRKPLWSGSFMYDEKNRPVFEKGEGGWRIWGDVVTGQHYYVGVDCARGEEMGESGHMRGTGDFASACVWCGETGEQVASLTAKIGPESMADELNRAGLYYNKAMLAIELTGNLGLWTQARLRDKYNYTNLYHWKGKDDKIKGMERSKSLGWETTGRTRDLIFSAFRTALREERTTVRANSLLTQMEAASRQDGMRWEVLVGHDDELIAAMIGWIALEQWAPPRHLGFSKPKEDAAEQLPLQYRSDHIYELKKHYDKVMNYTKRGKPNNRLEGI